MKVVINSDIGGFSLSDAAFEMLLNLKNIPFEKSKEHDAFGYTNYYKAGHLGEADHFLYEYDFTFNKKRADPDLIKVVEELGAKANGKFSNLKIIDIPDDIDWYLSISDMGPESIHEVHRSWS